VALCLDSYWLANQSYFSMRERSISKITRSLGSIFDSDMCLYAWPNLRLKTTGISYALMAPPVFFLNTLQIFKGVRVFPAKRDFIRILIRLWLRFGIVSCEYGVTWEESYLALYCHPVARKSDSWKSMALCPCWHMLPFSITRQTVCFY